MSSLERCPSFRVSFKERLHCSPVGATSVWVTGCPPPPAGLAQCAELCWQLRGEAGARQVPHTRLALQHNIGLGGAVVVTLYRRGFPSQARGSRRVGAAYVSGGLKSAPVFDEIERTLRTVCLAQLDVHGS